MKTLILAAISCSLLFLGADISGWMASRRRKPEHSHSPIASRTSTRLRKFIGDIGTGREQMAVASRRSIK